MLLSQHARRKRCFGVVRFYRYCGLCDDRTVVELRGDEMDGTAVNPDAGSKRAPVRVQAGKGRQQRRVNVEESATVALDESIGEHAHETGKQHEVRGMFVDRRRERRIERRAIGVTAVLDDGRGDPVRSRNIESGGVRHVTHDCDDIGG